MDTKKEKSEATTDAQNAATPAATLAEQKVIRQASRRALCPVSWVQYEAGWHAYREKPVASVVAKAINCSLAVAAHLIENGYPEQEMQAYGDRIASVRKVARQIEDYNLARAMAENGQILRGIKIKLRQALGPKFENLAFDQDALSKLTPNKAYVLAQFMDRLFRLEAYALREGVDETRVRIESNTDGAGTTEAAGKLARLLSEIENAVQYKPFASGSGIIDADFIDQTLAEEQPEPTEESGESFDLVSKEIAGANHE